jgi:hypothetical protein
MFTNNNHFPKFEIIESNRVSCRLNKWQENLWNEFKFIRWEKMWILSYNSFKWYWWIHFVVKIQRIDLFDHRIDREIFKNLILSIYQHNRVSINYWVIKIKQIECLYSSSQDEIGTHLFKLFNFLPKYIDIFYAKLQ